MIGVVFETEIVSESRAQVSARKLVDSIDSVLASIPVKGTALEICLKGEGITGGDVSSLLRALTRLGVAALRVGKRA